MTTLKFATLVSLAASFAAVGSAGAQSGVLPWYAHGVQQTDRWCSMHPGECRHDRDMRQDRRDVRHDEHDISQDRRDLYWDSKAGRWREVQRDKRELAQDHHDLRQDQHDKSRDKSGNHRFW